MSVQVEQYDSETTHRRTISVEGFESTIAVTVRKDRLFADRSWAPATISWPTIGAQSVAVARVLVTALERGIILAVELDLEYPEVNR